MYIYTQLLKPTKYRSKQIKLQQFVMFYSHFMWIHLMESFTFHGKIQDITSFNYYSNITHRDNQTDNKIPWLISFYIDMMSISWIILLLLMGFRSTITLHLIPFHTRTKKTLNSFFLLSITFKLKKKDDVHKISRSSSFLNIFICNRHYISLNNSHNNKSCRINIVDIMPAKASLSRKFKFWIAEGIIYFWWEIQIWKSFIRSLHFIIFIFFSMFSECCDFFLDSFFTLHCMPANTSEVSVFFLSNHHWYDSNEYNLNSMHGLSLIKKNEFIPIFFFQRRNWNPHTGERTNNRVFHVCDDTNSWILKHFDYVDFKKNIIT